eukprot:GHUV01048929.1.p2 GENE.GHUV01048929.1~~GHUV01048929.1.p2  ORF type:complete len:276 (-),score=67.87 GHUV01048929.1:168-995(-)
MCCFAAVLYCREQFFEQEIATIRKRELKLQFRNAVIKTINIAMVFGTPPMTACVIFAAYELMVGRLAATLAFTTLSLFNILRFPLVVLPKAMRALSEALASMQRIEAFLLQDVPTDAEGVTKSSRAGIRIRNAQFKHYGKDNFTLNVPEFTCNPGELVAVVGRVGAGKSSLMHAILGNMQPTSGQNEAGGRVSYVPQNPWCQNLTLRENILFGLPFEEHRYERVSVVQLCCMCHVMYRGCCLLTAGYSCMQSLSPGPVIHTLLLACSSWPCRPYL